MKLLPDNLVQLVTSITVVWVFVLMAYRQRRYRYLVGAIRTVLYDAGYGQVKGEEYKRLCHLVKYTPPKPLEEPSEPAARKRRSVVKRTDL